MAADTVEKVILEKQVRKRALADALFDGSGVGPDNLVDDMIKMTKAQYIPAVAEKAQVTKAEAEKIINAIDKVVHEKVVEGFAVPVPGIGKVGAIDRPERQIRNPATGVTFLKLAHKAPKSIYWQGFERCGVG